MNTRNARILIGGLLCAGAVGAAPVQWTVASGGNGHWYEAISAPNMDWTTARAAAQARGGHLATITSAAENAFVAALVPDAGAAENPYWLGGIRLGGSPNAAIGWEWITGEAWGYTNWAVGEPNSPGENSLAFAFFAGGDSWNNAPTSFTGYANGGYVVEYVPEPASLALVLAALAGLGASRRRTRG